uniref:Phosphodiesterase n=1 Tax=Syphacia muris TaxID=451379 RepID=A0A158R402_9BILA
MSHLIDYFAGPRKRLIISRTSKPRVSNSTFSTVTSATGLPTIGAEPSRPRSSRSSNESSEESIHTVDGIIYDIKELDNDSTLERISEWAFPIFDFGEQNKTTALSKIAYAIFKQYDLFRIFKIPLVKFFNFFHALERGYWDVPYHNRFHAADVMHGCYYLTYHPVKPKFGCMDNTSSLSADAFSMPIADSMSTLELMALYTAAAMHDYDHPGRTNAFLVASEDRKAILYNDRSVLENHHAAESWKLLCKPENFFIEGFDAAEAKRFRFLVLEYILATDLKQHFDIIIEFREKSLEMDLSNESDRVIISQMLIKFADINSPAKPYDLHVQWTKRLCEEFYSQGDEEKRLGLAVSPYMDRNEPAVAKLQDSFISHMVTPLAHALNEAGLLPSFPGLPKAEVMMNLEFNHTKWLKELEKERSAVDEDDEG